MTRLALFLACCALGAASAQAVTGPSASTRPTCKPGDGILLTVQNEPTLSDTFTVTPALSVMLPNVGEVSVAGVPRDDLTAHFTTVLGKFLRRPTVTARAMVRVGVVGEVAKPGFYPVPVDEVFADALMAAGGPTKDAKVKALFVERSGKRVHDPVELRRALERNATVNDIDLQSGDLITVPKDRSTDTETWIRILALAVTIPVAVVTLMHIR